MTAQVQPFAFDRVFTTPGSARDRGRTVSDLLIEIGSLRAEVAELRTRRDDAIAIARAEGFDTGLMQARAERDVALLSAVDALHAGIEAIDERFADIATRVTGDATEVALAAAELLAARTIEAAPAAAIDAALGRVLRQVARGTELQVRVHPDLLEAVEANLAERQSQDRRKLRVVIVGDEDMALGDAHIGWEQGALALDAAQRRAEIQAELETLLPTA